MPESNIPKVHCAFKKMVPVSSMVPHPKNPNHHDDEQVRILAKLIMAQGWRAPITVSNLTGRIVTGHGRLAAAKKLGLAEVPVDYQDFDSEVQELAHLVADNRIPELATMHMSELKDILLSLDTGDFDMELTAFTEDVLEQMMTSAADIPTATIETEKGTKSVTCPNCGFDMEVS